MITNETNQAEISGRVLTQPCLSHSIYGESFYAFMIHVPRLSGNADILPVVVSERVIDRMTVSEGDEVLIRGQLRSYNKIVDGASRLELKVFAREMHPWAEEEYLNRIDMIGFLCKPPVYRTTPFGREITDMLIAVNRSYNKSDYIYPLSYGGKTPRWRGNSRWGKRSAWRGGYRAGNMKSSWKTGKRSRG